MKKKSDQGGIESSKASESRLSYCVSKKSDQGGIERKHPHRPEPDEIKKKSDQGGIERILTL